MPLPSLDSLPCVDVSVGISSGTILPSPDGGMGTGGGNPVHAGSFMLAQDFEVTRVASGVPPFEEGVAVP